jgi:cytochrome c
MKKFSILFLLVMVVTFTVVSGQKEKVEKMMDPHAELDKSVARGKALFMDPKLGTSGMSCNSCHMEGGTKKGKMKDMVIQPFSNEAAEYPKYFMMAKKVMTLDQVINWCIVKPMKGEPLAWDDTRMADLAAYIASVKPAE